jgi:hypothetical protein
LGFGGGAAGAAGAAAATLAAADAPSVVLGSLESPASQATARTMKSPPPSAVSQSGVFGSSGTGSSCASAVAEWTSSSSVCATSSWADAWLTSMHHRE